jgi:hypothetical protein
MNDKTKEIVQTNELGGNLIALAIEKGADVDSLSKLMDLQERQMAKQAEQLYNRAITGFQSKLQPISKNKDSYVGSYATLDHIAKSIAPLLAEYELSYSFESEIKDGIVEVVCQISHIDGHSRTAKFTAPIDKAAKVNDMQKTASALSYARRYALQLALGITTTDEDDDGELGGLQTITFDQAIVLNDLMNEVGADKANFLKYCKVDDMNMLPLSKFDEAKRALEEKRK